MSLSKKYSLIIMGDNNSTRGLRMSKCTMQIIIASLVIIPILLILSISLAVQSVQKEQNMRMSFNSQQQELIELRAKVERLSNLSTLLEKYDNSYLSKHEQEDTTKTNEVKNKENLLAESSTQDAKLKTEPKIESDKANLPKENIKENITETALKDQRNQESVPLTEFEDNGNSSEAMDMNLAKIDKLKVRQTNDNNLQVSFDLINTEQKNQLEGNVQFFLLDKSGNKIPLNSNARSLSYRINKLKKVVVEAKYDAGKINPQEHILIIEINNSPEGIIYREQVALITE